jgi:hypothetical protein
MAILTVKEKKESGFRQKIDVTEPEEIMAFCPACKALQTIWLQGDGLMSTQKFYQKDGRIYHNCGSPLPCRLYHSG